MSKEAEIAKLKTRKRVVKAGFTRIENFIEGMDQNTVEVEELKLRLNRLEELRASLEEILIELSSHDANLTEEVVQQQVAEYEEKYVRLRSIGNRLINNRVRPAISNSNSDAYIGSMEAARRPINESAVRLLKIDLPTFSGAYEDWHPFHDTFCSLIHSNESLSAVQKFHYLKSALKDDAAEVITSLEISAVNYMDAWARLKERFEDERMAIQNHIKAIFELPALKRENGVALRTIVDGVLKHLRALRAVKRPTDKWDDLLVHIITSKLDFVTMKEWENSLNSKQIPKFSELIEFLNKRCQTLEAVSRRSQLTLSSHNNTRQNSSIKSTAVHTTIANSKCNHCKGDHPLHQCRSFRELSVSERIDKIKSKNLCLNCLKGKHFARECTSGGCKKCSKRHNTLLHEERNSSQGKNEEVTQNTTQETDISKTTSAICTQSRTTEVIKSNQVLLSTALINVKNQQGQYVSGRALLDSGSQSNFITAEFAKRLELKTINNRIQVKGINQSVSQALKSVNLNVTSRFGTFNMDLQCIILHEITQNLPAIALETTSLNIPSKIKLADPKFNIPGKIDMLIGADRFWELLCVGQIRLGKDLPTLQKSLLGWLVSGSVCAPVPRKNLQTNCNLSVNESLQHAVRQFWEVEEGLGKENNSWEEEYCENHFKANVERQSEGRFIVKLPVKEERLYLLDNTREIAFKRFLALERKFAKDPELKLEYVKFMKEYLELKHMKRIDNSRQNKIRNFLPHHAVRKKDRITTKTRVVFDASSKNSRGKSLNDALYKGPILQADLFTIIVRFRCFKFVLCADIKMMYRQILVHESQTSLQTILWREDPERDIEEYELNTVTYGTKPASFLAVRCLLELADREKERFPKAAEVVCRDFYMDDLLTGGETIDEVIELKEELSKLLAKGGFTLHKWNTNIRNILDNITTSDNSIDINKDQQAKLLGIEWNPNKDTFHYEISTKEHDGRVTKRAMLSQICRLFDPLGLVGPVISAAKILMQRLWSLGLDWEESVPMDIHKYWNEIKAQLSLLDSLEIPRAIVSGDNEVQIEIHGFCDASEKAYGACVYLREQNQSDKISVTLICSKSRVAPMKALSLPRLELCGAVLLVRLMNRVKASLSIKIKQTTYWTDSKIVLAWIRAESRKWQTFVSNRVSEIHDGSSPSEWYHVRSKENPADLISRGVLPGQLVKMKLWWEGPHWLSLNEDSWPEEGEELSVEHIPEVRKQAVIGIAVESRALIDYDRYSSLNKLLRVVSYVLRFIYNIKMKKNERRIGIVSVHELEEAKLAIIKMIQEAEFEEDIKALKKNNAVLRSSRLISLQPHLDDKGILRVGGRLKNAVIPDDMKHPIIIPGSHQFTKLLMIHFHEKLFHAGTQTTLNSIKEEFWPLLAKNRIKGIIRDCIRCRKAEPRPSWQIMGQLPAVRVNSSRPFLNTGVDYCGPFYTRDRVRRNARKYKAYVAIFICMATKAVHIELVENLTSDAFVAALKRLCARRGKIQNIYSDNGRNFVGADQELQKIWDEESFKESVTEFASTERIVWHFIPARSPHYGGLWEAAVRSMKLHLKRTLGDTCLTFSELTTVLTQVEAIMNSRPLTPLSDDPNDLRAITPGHFLIGENLQTYPERDVRDVAVNRLSRLQHIEQIKQHFWSRWQKEYLSTCQQRSKWKTDSKVKLAIGHLVMLKDNETLPLQWTLARITEIHPGENGFVRAVTVRTEKGTYKRAVINICPLIED